MINDAEKTGCLVGSKNKEDEVADDTNKENNEEQSCAKRAKGTVVHGYLQFKFT